MTIISTDVLDTVLIFDESTESGTRLINACDLTDDDKVFEEIAKGAKRTRKVVEVAAPEAPAPDSEPAPEVIEDPAPVDPIPEAPAPEA